MRLSLQAAYNLLRLLHQPNAAIQSLLNAGFRSAAQVEFVVMIGDEGLHPVTKAVGFRSFRNFVPKHAFARYCW